MYERIALDIAHRIAQGQLPEGKRLSGRSLMSSEYGVSPETIRRAFSLLDEQQVVQVLQNSGVKVLSQENAKSYIERYSSWSNTRQMVLRMRALIAEHERIEHELFTITRDLVDLIERFSASKSFFGY
jgi:DNA-binding GntR family transcriptional regulator